MVQEFIGAWSLKSALAAPVGQSPQPFMGAHPRGLLIFSKNGMMNLTLVPQEDPHGFGINFASGPYEVTNDEITASGARAVDFSHTIKTAADSDLIDDVKDRTCEVSPDGASLTLRVRDYYVPGGGKLDVTLTWERA